MGHFVVATIYFFLFDEREVFKLLDDLDDFDGCALLTTAEEGFKEGFELLDAVTVDGRSVTP